MCGLIGGFSRAGRTLDEAPIRGGLSRMARRGPDGEGLWREEDVTLGHRRLAILDLDSRAAQPMHSSCGRYCMVYNGEIYNFRNLRADLEQKGITFQTTSDTEVVLKLFAEEGPAMLPRLHGMFAMVIWDRLAKRGFAARDPYGIKPLYVADTDQGVLLASQVKALLATGLVSRDPNHLGQAGFWLLGSVPEPHTWYRNIRTIPAGHYAWIENGRAGEPKEWLNLARAWHPETSLSAPEKEVRERVDAALRESVGRHLVADVPVGVFLSGGIDSGALAALMAEVGSGALEGVTVAYDEYKGLEEDEAPGASRIAAAYGIRHRVRRVTRDEFQADLPRILAAMDQPSIDGINTWYASKAAAEAGLKVVVSGVGGDELFQGYAAFRQLPRVVAARCALQRVPGAAAALQWLADRQAAWTGNSRWRHAPRWTRTIEGAWWLRRSLFAPDDLAGLMEPEAARAAMALFEPDRIVPQMSGSLPADPRLALGQLESTLYLRNQLLRDSDWASMDHSVELRTPLVDAHLLRQMTPLLKAFTRFPGKSLLAEAPAVPLPREIVGRRKTGFGVPVTVWMSPDPAGSRPYGMKDLARAVAAAYSSGRQ
jgi:asparagine synthase (glutamine-hydrolysing)